MTNSRAERVRAVAQLARPAGRRRRGLFLAAGPQAVCEAVRFAPVQVRAVYLIVEAAQRHAEFTVSTTGAGVYPLSFPPAALAVLIGHAHGVVAVVRQLTATTADLFAGPEPPRLLAACAQVRDPGNAGTVIRAADAAGAQGVLLSSGSVDVHNPKVVRSTAGSLFHLP